jgi:hypothetical protein
MMDVGDSGTHWMEPGDYRIQELLACTGRLRDCVKGKVEGRAYILFADGDIWCLRSDIPMDIIKPFFTLDGARNQGDKAALDEYCIRKLKLTGMIPRKSNTE